MPSIPRTPHLQSPWGTYAPGPVRRFLLGLSRSASNSALGRRLALEARRVGRLGLRGPLDTEVWGLRLRLFPRGNVSEARLLFMPQLLDAAERGALAEAAGPGWVFVDLGANVGSYTYWAASLGMDGARILAVEPDPELHATLSFNLKTNRLDQVTVFAGAVAEQTGARVLEVSSHNRGENVLRERQADGERSGKHGGPDPSPAGADATTSVMALSLVDLLDREALDRVDALKIDLEGEELPVLRAFLQAAPRQRWPRLLITEWKGTRDAQALAGLLEGSGYGPVVSTRLNRVYRLP